MTENEEKKQNKRLSRLALILLQLLLTAAVLCVFALFHHVIPRVMLQRQGMPEPIAAVPYAPTPTPAERPRQGIAPEETEASEDAAEEAQPAPEETPEPAPLSWKERFADRFSEEVLSDDWSYRSPDLAVFVSEFRNPERHPELCYYVADIYLADVEQLRAAFPLNGFTFALPAAIARDDGAVVAINGDCFMDQQDGFVVRNGKLYFNEDTPADVCVLYHDGRIETLGPDEYSRQTVLDGGPWQIWRFGPKLLDAEGKACESFNIDPLLLRVHPRTALGYYEPGHYCFVVVDGRQGHSLGAEMDTLAQIMEELGCASAYNLDGGGSSNLYFNGRIVNTPYGDRYINDVISVGEPREGSS